MVTRRVVTPPYRLDSAMTASLPRGRVRGPRAAMWTKQWCATAGVLSRSARRVSRSGHVVRIRPLRVRALAPLVGDRQSPVASESLEGDLRPGRVLAPLPLRPVDEPRHTGHELGFVACGHDVGDAPTT